MKIILVFFCFFLSITTYGYAQKKNSILFSKISRPEKLWIITHPLIAKKVFKITTQALAITDSISKTNLLDSDGNGGQLDAFRHGYWMALLSKEISYKKAISLGEKHEKGNKIDFEKNKLEDGILPDSISTVMDLANNTVGANLGMKNKHLSPTLLANLIKKEIMLGSFFILKKDSNKKFIDCEGNSITESTIKRWNIEKCLIKSNGLPR